MNSLAGGSSDGGPPPIPGSRQRTVGDSGQLLLWVRTGRARILSEDGTEVHLGAGEGVWIPADEGRDREIVTEPGTVAFPFWPLADPSAGTVSAVTRFAVPQGWHDWLIQLFNLQVTPLAGPGYSADELLGLLGAQAPPERAEEGSGGAPETPALPRAGSARAVAEALMRDPALDLTVEEWGRRVLSSPRTLLRDFLADTGLTFEQWRLRCRMSAAVEFLAAGYDLGQVAARVGFSSRGGFRHAFARELGLTPHQFRRAHVIQPARSGSTARVTAARQTNDVVRLVRGGDFPDSAHGMMPPARTPLHSNGVHVLSWMYRGSGYLDIGDRHYERECGVATWIPADAEHITGLRKNSVSLPLGNASVEELTLTEPLQVQFTSAWDDYLMFCSISARSALRPDGHDPRHILDLFAEQLAAQRALAVPMPTSAHAREAALRVLRLIVSGGGSIVIDLPPEVHRAFRNETGMSFARWRYAARMRVARDLLAGGAKPSAVARRVGYAHLPTFSAAFSRFHGLSPREYQERERDIGRW